MSTTDYKKEILSIIEREKDEKKRAEMVSHAIDFLSKAHAELTATDATRAQREYLKAWRANNKDKVKRYNRKYWSGKANNGKY